MDIGKLILFGVAGYIGYEYFLSPAAVAATAPGGIQPGPTPPAVPAPVVNPNTTQALVLAAAKKANFTRGTVDEWDWYYGIARGIPAPDPGDWGFTDANRNEQLSFDEWWNIGAAHGLSDLPNYGQSAAHANARGILNRLTNRPPQSRSGYVRTGRLSVMEAE